MKKSTSLVSIQDQLRELAAAAAGRIAPPSGNVIRVTQDKKFNLPDGTKSEGPLDLVIIDFVSRNEYYEGSYDPNNIAPPVCFAIHPEPKLMVPSENSSDKQSDTCAACPQNQFGSSGKGKACKNTRVLAVLPPDADESTPLWLLKVSPTAIKGFDALIGSLSRMQAAPVQMVVEVGFNTSETFSSLVFADPRPNDNVAVHLARLDEAREALAVEPDTTRQAVQPAPRQVARKTTSARR